MRANDQRIWGRSRALREIKRQPGFVVVGASTPTVGAQTIGADVEPTKVVTVGSGYATVVGARAPSVVDVDIESGASIDVLVADDGRRVVVPARGGGTSCVEVGAGTIDVDVTSVSRVAGHSGSQYR